MKSKYNIAQGILRLWRLLGKESPVLIHAHLYDANFVGRIAGFLRGIPVVSSLHSVDYEPSRLQDNPQISPTKMKVLRLLDLLSCKIARPQFLAVSQYVKYSTVKHLGISPDKIRVIYNAINLSNFEPARKKNIHLDPGLQIHEDVPIIVCVARIHPEKGLRYLIEAVPIIVRQFPNIHVLFIGDGNTDTQRSYMTLAENLGIASHLQFLGRKIDIRPYLKACDIFVLPSLGEGLGITLLEAMAMERPCVASGVTAISEVIADGKSGILVDPANPPALALAIRRLLESPSLRAQMGSEGRRIVFEKFNADQNIIELENLYKDILGVQQN